jgi:predicted HicB family RNase H-like nuclease
MSRKPSPLSKIRPGGGYHKDIDALKAEIGQREKKTKRFNAEIPASLHAALKKRAIDEGMHLNELAVRIFEEYLSKGRNE